MFASEEWAPELYQAIKAGTDHIVAPAGPLNRGDTYVNATIGDFIDFYQRASPLWIEAEELPAGVDTSHSTPGGTGQHQGTSRDLPHRRALPRAQLA